MPSHSSKKKTYAVLKPSREGFWLQVREKTHNRRKERTFIPTSKEKVGETMKRTFECGNGKDI